MIFLNLLHGEQCGEFLRFLRHAERADGLNALGAIGCREGEQVQHSFHGGTKIRVVFRSVEITRQDVQRATGGILKRLTVVHAQSRLFVVCVLAFDERDGSFCV